MIRRELLHALLLWIAMIRGKKESTLSAPGRFWTDLFVGQALSPVKHYPKIAIDSEGLISQQFNGGQTWACFC